MESRLLMLPVSIREQFSSTGYQGSQKSKTDYLINRKPSAPAVTVTKPGGSASLSRQQESDYQLKTSEKLLDCSGRKRME